MVHWYIADGSLLQSGWFTGTERMAHSERMVYVLLHNACLTSTKKIVYSVLTVYLHNDGSLVHRDGLPVQSGCFSGFMAEIGRFSRIGMNGSAGSEKRYPQLWYGGSSGHRVEDSAGSQSRVQQDCYGPSAGSERRVRWVYRINRLGKDGSAC
jgi:hypothetical protein